MTATRELQTAQDRILDLERQLEHANKEALKQSAEVARLQAGLEDAAAKVCFYSREMDGG